MGTQASIGPDLLIFDADQNAWFLDPETAQALPIGSAQQYFVGADCDGAAYLTVVLPRRVFPGDPWGDVGSFFVRPDDLQSTEVCVNSWFYQASCLEYELCGRFLEFNAVLPAGPPPAQGWVAPLHPEPL